MRYTWSSWSSRYSPKFHKILSLFPADIILNNLLVLWKGVLKISSLSFNALILKINNEHFCTYRMYKIILSWFSNTAPTDNSFQWEWWKWGAWYRYRNLPRWGAWYPGKLLYRYHIFRDTGIVSHACFDVTHCFNIFHGLPFSASFWFILHAI
jgi:hypothetical protein